MRESFDVVILGCGEAGIFAAYELEKLNPGLKLLAIDQGPDIYHRSCPIVSGKVRECIHCPICHTMCGFGGAGVTRGLAQAGASGVQAARAISKRLK